MFIPLLLLAFGSFRLFLDDWNSGPSALISVSFSVNSAGSASGSGENPATFGWADPGGTGIGNSYECRVIITLGDNPTTGPTVNDWHALSTSRTWQWNTGLQATCILQIRRIGTSNVLASCTIQVR